LRNICHVLEAIPKEALSVNNQRTSSNKTASSKSRQSLLETQSKVNCHICEENHNIQNCEKFKNMSHSEKSESIKRAGLCFNCFRANHNVSACKANNCKKCDRRHHTMLHPLKSGEAVQTAKETNKQDSQGKDQDPNAVSQSLSSRLGYDSQIILSTAVVNVADASDVITLVE